MKKPRIGNQESIINRINWVECDFSNTIQNRWKFETYFYSSHKYNSFDMLDDHIWNIVAEKNADNR